jgi:HK97 family phage major capsid protein
MNSVEILDKKNQLKIRANEILDNCKVEIRDLNEAEQQEIDSIRNEINDLNEELRKLDVELGDSFKEKINTEKIKKNTMKEFRLLTAINDIANNRTLDETAKAVVEKGTEEMRKAGLSFNGQIQLPLTEERATITVEAEGEDVVETKLTNILEPLRAKNVLIQAGAKFMSGLIGDVQVPLMSAGNVTWEGEVAPAKDGAQSFTSVKLQPKRLTAYVDVSKQFLIQDSLDAENLIKADIVNAINSKLEATILGSSAGTATQPQGIFYSDSALTSIASFADVCNLESDVEDANVIGECKYVMSNKAKAAFRNMAKSTKSTQLVMEGGQIDGTPVLNTSNVEGKNVAYGDFSNLAIAQWGGIDLTVDPFTKAADGQVRLVINAYFDAKVLRPEAIKIATVA